MGKKGPFIFLVEKIVKGYLYVGTNMMWFQVFEGDELVARLNDELRKDLLVTDETWWQRDDEVDLNWKAANIE